MTDEKNSFSLTDTITDFSDWNLTFNFKNYIHNLRLIKNKLNGKKLCLVLKSDAYGCGLEKLFKKILPLKIVDYIAITENSEARTIRKYCKKIKILRIKPAGLKEIHNGMKYNIEEILDSIEKIEIVKKNFKNIAVHLSIDSEMNNLGINIEDINIDDIIDLNIVGIMTHFPDTIEKNNKFNIGPINFNKLYNRLKSDFFPNIIGHVENSINFIENKNNHYDMSRVGKITYGMFRKFNQNIHFKQVIQWETRVLNSKIIKKGENIGYNYLYKTEKTMRILVLDCGYNKGFPSVYNNNNVFIKVNDHKQKIVGSVNMNTIVVDIHNINEPIEKIILLGDGIYLEDIVNEKQISAYSVFYNIMRNNNIIYLEE